MKAVKVEVMRWANEEAKREEKERASEVSEKAPAAKTLGKSEDFW